jgi:hypothetical protein
MTDFCVPSEWVFGIGERPLLKTGLGVFKELGCDCALFTVLRDGERELLVGNTVREGLRTMGRCMPLMTKVKDLSQEVYSALGVIS